MFMHSIVSASANVKEFFHNDEISIPITLGRLVVFSND